eukprot:10447-Rhodomonas_salina.1
MPHQRCNARSTRSRRRRAARRATASVTLCYRATALGTASRARSAVTSATAHWRAQLARPIPSGARQGRCARRGASPALRTPCRLAESRLARATLAMPGTARQHAQRASQAPSSLRRVLGVVNRASRVSFRAGLRRQCARRARQAGTRCRRARSARATSGSRGLIWKRTDPVSSAREARTRGEPAPALGLLS